MKENEVKGAMCLNLMKKGNGEMVWSYHFLKKWKYLKILSQEYKFDKKQSRA